MNSAKQLSNSSEDFLFWQQAFVLFIGACVYALLAGFFRVQTAFLPGLQGLVGAGMLAAWHGKTVRGNTAVAWRGGQRFWYWLNLTATFTLITRKKGSPIKGRRSEKGVS